MGQLTTFQDQYQLAQGLAHFSDATQTALFKRNVNTGASKLMSGMHRSYTRASRTADLVANQIYYSAPEDAFKIRGVVTHIGGIARGLTRVASEDDWNRLNQVPLAGYPNLYFARGFDEVGLYPAYGSALADGLELIFTRRHLNMTQDDYLTGSVAATNGSQTITGTGTSWTSAMAGRAFEITSSSDANWYRVASVESATSLTLENFYQGLTGSGLTYRIGECAFLPEEFLEVPVDFALMRFYLGRDQAKYGQYKTSWEEAFEDLRSEYSNPTESNVIDVNPQIQALDPLRSNISIRTS